ncbi:hypothetical protein OC844_006416, partial [Tilletia horrida]
MDLQGAKRALYKAERELFQLWASYIMGLQTTYKTDSLSQACRQIEEITSALSDFDFEPGVSINVDAWQSFLYTAAEYRFPQQEGIVGNPPGTPECEYDVIQAAFQQLRGTRTQERYDELVANFPSSPPAETRTRR